MVCLNRRHPVKVHSKVTGQESEWQEKDCDESKYEGILSEYAKSCSQFLQTTKENNKQIPYVNFFILSFWDDPMVLKIRSILYPRH